MRVYADNAATTKLSAAAKEAMLPYFDEIYGNPSTLYTLGQEAAEHLLACRTEIAQLIGAADPREIVFTSGGSEADNQAIVSAAENGARKGKKHLISTKFEHHAVLHTLDKLRRQGFEVTLLDVHEDGVVRVEDVAAAIRDDTALVSVMFANNEIGTLQPIQAIGALCRERGIPFHTDAVQAIGHVPVDVQAMNIDLLSCSAHKFHGPKGIGALYIRKGVKIDPLIHGGAQERGHRAGTENLPGIVGLGKAIELAEEGLAENAARMTFLRNRLISGLTAAIPNMRINGTMDKRLPNNVNVSFAGIEGEAVLLRLDLEGIAASSGSACTAGSLDPSHVLTAIGLWLGSRPMEVPWYLIPLGFCPTWFQSSDYFPLFPNLGYFLLGAVLGRALYAEKKSLLPRENPPAKALQWMGRKSLLIYLLHQPILAAVVGAIAMIKG